MKTIIQLTFVLFCLSQFAFGEVGHNDLKLYLSHKYISRALETSKANVSCVTPANQTREQYIHEAEMENLQFKNKLESLLEPQNSEAAIAFLKNKLKWYSHLENSTDRYPSELIKVTESKELLNDLSLRVRVKNNNIYVASLYISDFLSGKISDPDIAKVLYYSDVVHSGGYVRSRIPCLEK